ncbi:hypothetical protein [Prevotella denticola]|uniref:hypothetical protein n=1 Tax=Prevotella denticola TaxID=28129 RepID=UPI002432BFC1|nr:hypothetical protein [Prevotella denticola]
MSDKPYLQFHQTLPGLSDKVHSQFHQTLPKLSDKPRLQFHQTLPELSDKPHLIFFQTLPELSDKPHLPFFQTPHELSDKAHLIFFQTLPESRNVQNSFEFYPPPPLRIQPKNNLHSEEENLLPYHDEIILRTGMPSPNTSSRNILCFHFLFAVVLHRLSVFFECPDPLLSYTVILPPFRSFSLFCRRSPTHFSPASATGFLCLFSCFPAVEKSQNNVSENIKTYIYKNKFISLFSYLSAQIFFYYNFHLLI